MVNENKNRQPRLTVFCFAGGRGDVRTILNKMIADLRCHFLRLYSTFQVSPDFTPAIAGSR